MDNSSNIARRRRSARADGSADYAAKREELVRIAANLFKVQGYQSTKLADIAQAAGLDRATVYYYVGSKEELFQETVEGVLDVIIAEGARLVNDASLSWLERLHQIYVRLMVTYEENYPATFVYIKEQMHEVANEESAWAQEIMKKTRALDHRLLSFIKEAIAAGELRSDIGPRMVENALFGMLNWTHRWFEPDGPLTGREVAESLWSIFISGARPQQRAGNVRRTDSSGTSPRKRPSSGSPKIRRAAP